MRRRWLGKAGRVRVSGDAGWVGGVGAPAAATSAAGDLDLRAILSSISGAVDLEPSTPLSAPDLRLLSSHLSHHSSQLRSRALSFLLESRHSLSSAFSSAAEAASLSSALSDSISSLNSSLDLCLDVEIRRIADEIVASRRELAERREQLEAVNAVAAAVERIGNARKEVSSGRIYEAAAALQGLNKELFVDGGTGGGDEPKVIGLLQKEWTALFDEVQILLTKSLEACLRFEEGKVTVLSRLNGGDVGHSELRIILNAFEVIGDLDYGMAKVADLMMKHVFVPIISSRITDICIDTLNQDEGPIAVLKFVQTDGLQDDYDGAALYSSLIKVVNFVSKYFCLENHSWISSFGKMTWSQISELVITHFLSKVVPDVASKLIDFQDVLRSTVDFEISLSKMCFIAADGKDSKLTKFVNDVELYFAARKRNEFLVNARKLLVPYDYIDPFGSETDCADFVVELLIEPERCLISRSAFKLMKLVHEVLKDACSSSPRVAKEFLNVSRDALLLYKAIVPVQLEKLLGKKSDGISQVAMIVHNDFYYMSQEILGLAYEHRADLPIGLQKSAVFIDLAPSFHKLAEDILQRQVQLAISILSEDLNGCHGFENTHLPQQYQSAKMSIEQVISRIENYHIKFVSSLPASAFQRSMRAVLEYVFSRITKDILGLYEMAAEETYQLQLLIQLMLGNLSTLLSSFIAKGDGKGKTLDDNSLALLDRALPSLPKLRKLAELLDLPLASITAAWEIGELSHCGYTSNEVGGLVRSIFTDSPLRRSCLSKIENSGP